MSRIRKILLTIICCFIASNIIACGGSGGGGGNIEKKTYYEDADNDGFGNPNVYVMDTSQPDGYVTDNSDCDDTDSFINPASDEIADDGIDNDCDGFFAVTYYADNDGDGFGDPDNTIVETSQPAGYVTDNTDCDDTDESVYPGMEEFLDGKDNDCDGQVDEGFIRVQYDHLTIQEAIDAANDGETVVVDDGTYTENINFSGKAIKVMSVNGSGSTIIDGNLISSVVTFNTGEGADSVLSGFTIINGSGTDVYDDGSKYAGGIYCDNASPTISDCIINGNFADYGGGIYCDTSLPIISVCTISGNLAVSDGGGIYCYNSSSPIITDCTITGNTAYWGGGIICNQNASPTISDCTVSDNSAEYGGGIECFDGSSPIIKGCTIAGNSAVNDGGGIECGFASPKISKCTITGNSASLGGGIDIWYCTDGLMTVTNCTIAGNTGDNGGGIYCESSSPTIINCTIAGNYAAEKGGGFFGYTSPSAVMFNSILWGDTAVVEGDEISLDDGSGFPYSDKFTYSDIQGGWTGLGNINDDPLFVDADNGDYHLSAGSPCIDAGTFFGAPADDIDGDARPQGLTMDIGSDEEN